MKNILVAIANPKNSDKLIDQAVKFAKHTNAKIWVMHVTEPNPDDFLALESGPQYIYDQRTEHRKKEAAFVRQCAEEITKNFDLPAEGLLIEGSISKAIKQKVEEHDIELVVAGHKRKSFLYDLFTTNKKKDLIDELNIPLLAVPIG